MAGLKPQEEIDFKNVLQQKLQQAGVDRYMQMLCYAMWCYVLCYVMLYFVLLQLCDVMRCDVL